MPNRWQQAVSLTRSMPVVHQETVVLSHIMLTQPTRIAKAGRRLRRNWRLLEKSNGFHQVHLVDNSKLTATLLMSSGLGASTSQRCSIVEHVIGRHVLFSNTLSGISRRVPRNRLFSGNRVPFSSTKPRMTLQIKRLLMMTARNSNAGSDNRVLFSNTVSQANLSVKEILSP